MEKLLAAVGLSKKESSIYLVLLENGMSTASNIASLISESRTNTYMLIESLISKRMILQDDSKVKKFNAADPRKIQSIMDAKQRELQDLSIQLQNRLPELSSKFSLANHRPGVAHRQGIEGFKESLLDMERCADEVLIIPSHITDDNREAYVMLQKALARRRAKGISSRSVLHEAGRQYNDIEAWPKKGIEVRFLGEKFYEGEVVIYADKCAFTVYAPTIIVTTITNKVIADTMRTVFENLWGSAKP